MRPVFLHIYLFRHFTTLPNNLFKALFVDLTERVFKREGSLSTACNDRHAFFIPEAVRKHI